MDKLDELIMKAAEGYVDPDVERIEQMDLSSMETSPRMQRFGEALKVYERDEITGAVLFPGYPEFCRGDCEECKRRFVCFPGSEQNIQRAMTEIQFIGWELRRQRLKLKKSVEAVACLSGVSREDVLNIEQGVDVADRA